MKTARNRTEHHGGSRPRARGAGQRHRKAVLVVHSFGTKNRFKPSTDERFCAARTREMFVSTASNDQARKRLLAVVDKVDGDVAAVALWACELSGFAQPLRDYEPDDLNTDYFRAALKLEE
jgi:hypothetical protein